MSDRVDIREVGPRDGFQNEPEVIPTAEKVRLIELLARTGVQRLEVTSFVKAEVIPQLADGAEVLEKADIPEDVSVTVLIPNEKGLDNALAQRNKFDEVNLFLSATETHNVKNVNRSVEESLTGLERVIELAHGVDHAIRDVHLVVDRELNGDGRPLIDRRRRSRHAVLVLPVLVNQEVTMPAVDAEDTQHEEIGD